MLLSTCNPTPTSSQGITVKNSGGIIGGENLYNNNPKPILVATATTTLEQHLSMQQQSLLPTTTTTSSTTRVSSSSSSVATPTENYATDNHQFHTDVAAESKPSSDTATTTTRTTRMQPPTTTTNFPIITNPSIRSTPPLPPLPLPTTFNSFPNNFLAPPLFSSSPSATSHHQLSKTPPTLSSSTMTAPSLVPSINTTTTTNSKTNSSLDHHLPKPVPTAASILAPSLSLIETESNQSPQPIRVSALLSSFAATPPSSSSDNIITNKYQQQQPETIVNTSATPNKVNNRVGKITPKRPLSEPTADGGGISSSTKHIVEPPTTPNNKFEQPHTSKSEADSPFSTPYTKPLSSFPLHHPSSATTSGGNTFLPFPPPVLASSSGSITPTAPSTSFNNNNSSSRLQSPSTPTTSPFSFWPNTTVPVIVKQVVPPPPPPSLNGSPPNSAKKRKVTPTNGGQQQQDSIGASLQPLTPLTPPTPTHQFPFPSVRFPNASSSTFIPPPFPISSSSASLTPVKAVSNTTTTTGSGGSSVERKVPPADVPTLDLSRAKKRENMVSCNSIRIPFKSWMKTLETLSSPNLKAVQERVSQLLEKKEEEKKQQPLLKQEDQTTTTDVSSNDPINTNNSCSSSGATKLSNCSDETLLLLSTDLSSIDTLAILALADSPPSPVAATSNSTLVNNSISESVELFPSKSPEKLIESDDSDEEYAEEEIDLAMKTARVEPFSREYNGNGFIYPGRRGAKSQRMRLPLCFFPSMKLVMVADSGPETFVEGDEIVNPVIDLEHHLEFFIPDLDKQLYKSVKGLHLLLLKRVSKNFYIEESSVLVQRSARSEDGGYNFSAVNNQQTTPERNPDYSLLLIEARGKRRNAQEVDKVNRYCEVIHEQGTNQCKFKVGFRICKAQKKKHTKGIYLLRLVACLSEDEEINFNSSNQPTNGVMKVLEESEMFKIVSRRATVERTRVNCRPTNTSITTDC